MQTPDRHSAPWLKDRRGEVSWMGGKETGEGTVVALVSWTWPSEAFPPSVFLHYCVLGRQQTADSVLEGGKRGRSNGGTEGHLSRSTHGTTGLFPKAVHQASPFLTLELDCLVTAIIQSLAGNQCPSINDFNLCLLSHLSPRIYIPTHSLMLSLMLSTSCQALCPCHLCSDLPTSYSLAKHLLITSYNK